MVKKAIVMIFLSCLSIWGKGINDKNWKQSMDSEEIILAADYSSIYSDLNTYLNKMVKYDEYKSVRLDRPMLEFQGGLSDFSRKEFDGDFSESGSFYVNIGNSHVYSEDKGVFKMDEDFFTFGKLNTEYFTDDPENDEVACDLIRLGFANRNGYGYQIGFLSLTPYQAYSGMLTKLDKPDNMEGLSAKDQSIINRYADEFRFSYSTTAGARIGLGEMFAITGSYEANVIHPRFKFWECAGSAILERICEGILGEFVDEVKESSPGAAPIVNFVLKNGLSYSFFHMRKDGMDWPFDSERPLTYESFKVGLSFRF